MRRVFFWLHLATGAAAGVVILTMAVTGVLLAYERQVLDWAERGYRSKPSASVSRVPLDVLIKRARAYQQGSPATITIHADPAAPAEASFGRDMSLFLDPHTGEVLGKGHEGVRRFFRSVTSLHRWLGFDGPGKSTARAITAACNLAFLLLAVTGAYLWLPRKWTWQHIRAVLWFRGGLSGKPRDFNWHNVFGIWSWAPLLLLLVTALPMSYSWANDLLYTVTGSQVPAEGSSGNGRGANAKRDAVTSENQTGDHPFEDLDRLRTLAESLSPGWQSMSIKLPGRRGGPVAISIDLGNGGQPQKKSTLNFNSASGLLMSRETFAGNSRGRRLRSWARFIHTGEAAGLAGQTVAGIASAGGAMLVYTGLALALRRFLASLKRRSSRSRAIYSPIPAGSSTARTPFL